ncbi:hypothetical protein OHD16_10835 [Sphingobacterium sp. ML3W]|uniref:hypothetical protein n=1 Tax=Sphingobacterium sp. ML3W TaxID=1538644 RepID=UPI00249ADCB2|nr:hypothetical protein [Sphingobacterium sp. ML3W]WFA80457.1 hypothetical protein OGI71_03980 [Sphingobacterium sp. ML3W]
MDKKVIDFQLKATHVNWDDEKATVNYMLESSHLMAGQKPVNYAKEEKEFGRILAARVDLRLGKRTTGPTSTVQGQCQRYG